MSSTREEPILDRIKAFLFVALVCYIMVSHVFIMILSHLLVTLIFYYIAPRIFHKSMKLSEGSCSSLQLTLANFFRSSRYVLTFENEESYSRFRDSVEGGEEACANEFVISNHQIYTDWLYIWGLFTWMGKGGNIKITLKKSLQMVPIVGLGMRLCGFIFISRKWDVDREKFVRRIARLINFKPFSLLIFPEGSSQILLSICRDNFVPKWISKIIEICRKAGNQPNQAGFDSKNSRGLHGASCIEGSYKWLLGLDYQV